MALRVADAPPISRRVPDGCDHPRGGGMTLLRPSDWLLRLACGVIWYALSLALCVEIGALLGWALGAAGLGARLAVLPHGLAWLWLLAADRREGG